MKDGMFTTTTMGQAARGKKCSNPNKVLLSSRSGGNTGVNRARKATNTSWADCTGLGRTSPALRRLNVCRTRVDTTDYHTYLGAQVRYPRGKGDPWVAGLTLV